MIQAIITRVLFSYDMESHREEPDCAVLRLPNGMELRAPIDREHLAYFNECIKLELEGKKSEAVVETVYSAPEKAIPEAESKLEPVKPQDPSVRWMDLPASLLPDSVKKAMAALGDLPDILPLSLVSQIRDKIQAEFTPQDWAAAGVQVGPPAEVMVSAVAPKVRVDQAGNPYPADEPDPGEQVADDDSEEDQQF